MVRCCVGDVGDVLLGDGWKEVRRKKEFVKSAPQTRLELTWTIELHVPSRYDHEHGRLGTRTGRTRPDQTRPDQTRPYHTRR